MAVRSIEELLEQLDAATAGHDAHACAQLYHPNASHVMGTGEVVLGRAAHERQLTSAFANAPPPDVDFETSAAHVQLVTPTVAVVDTSGYHHRRTADGGREVLSAEAFTMFVIKEGDEWLIAAGRGTLPPKDPPPTGP